jgi:hypothetical protein
MLRPCIEWPFSIPHRKTLPLEAGRSLLLLANAALPRLGHESMSEQKTIGFSWRCRSRSDRTAEQTLITIPIHLDTFFVDLRMSLASMKP